MPDPAPLAVGLHPALGPWAPEVTYTLRTLLRIAGHPCAFRWAGTEGPPLDLYYGPPAGAPSATVCVPWSGRTFDLLDEAEPTGLVEGDGTARLAFDEAPGVEPGSDLVFAAYWCLMAPYETRAPRSRFDDLDLSDTAFRRLGLAATPLVSRWGAWLRGRFAAAGRQGLPLPWVGGGRDAAFAFTHDVDYPEVIRWLEPLRLLRSNGRRRLRVAADVARGASHYWTFQEWIDLERELGARPAFYFMARKGSLLRYALGTPDDFYDVRAPRFARLFRSLADQGCEIGLHASYHAHRSARMLREERERLEQAAGVPVAGNRHHYWHLDPGAPFETLRRHESAGLRYDSSLGLEYYPGFRRGICHPFRPYHPGERRELDVVQLPPAWMDDHFDRRLAMNGVTDPGAAARGLLDAVRETGGVAVVDYHSRGMNGAVYPRYGPWLAGLARQHLASGWDHATPGALVERYLGYERSLSDASSDLTRVVPTQVRGASQAAAPLDVGPLASGEAAAWDAYVAGHPGRTTYHTGAWRAVTEQGLGHRSHALRAVDGAGRVVGVLPLFLVTGPFGRRLVSVPMRDRGGVLADGEDVAGALVAAAARRAADLGAAYLEIRGLEPLPAAVSRAQDLACVSHWITTRIDLSKGRDALWSGLDKNAVRWAVNKARKEGVRVEEDVTAEGMDLFYRLFAHTRHGMGIPPFPPKLFRAIWEHLVRPGKAHLLLVRKGDIPIGGMVSFFESTDAYVPAYAAPQKAWRKSYPSEAAIWHAIEWAAARGFRTFDFGADSPEQAGLLFFKRKWGGVHRRMNYYYGFPGGVGTTPNFDSSSGTYALLRRIWMRLPGPVSRGLGAWVTRQLS